MKKNRRRTNISRFMTLVLRHSPEKFGLKLDSRGFVSLDVFLKVLQNRFSKIELMDIQKIVNSSPKERFEIKGDRIRARYGHSIRVNLEMKPFQAPQFLYHGTSPEAGEKIKREGLKPMKREYVHLSKTLNEAIAVGRRKSKRPLILKILAQRAQKEGTNFYDRGLVVVVKYLAPEFLEPMII